NYLDRIGPGSRSELRHQIERGSNNDAEHRRHGEEGPGPSRPTAPLGRFQAEATFAGPSSRLELDPINDATGASTCPSPNPQYLAVRKSASRWLNENPFQRQEHWFTNLIYQVYLVYHDRQVPKPRIPKLVKVSEDTHTRLAGMAKYGESMDDVIQRLSAQSK